MRESTTYMEIWEEGEAAGEIRAERRMLMIAGTKRFGEPDESTRAIVDTLDTTRIEALMERLFEVESWE